MQEIHLQFPNPGQWDEFVMTARFPDSNGFVCSYRYTQDGIPADQAPALAAADVSISPITAADLTQAQADAVFLGDRLAPVAEAVAISRRAHALMRQNLVIALVTVAGLLAGVFSGNVHMAGGMLVHQLSVLIVIANGMRLLRMPKTTAPGGRASKVATARPATVAARG